MKSVIYKPETYDLYNADEIDSKRIALFSGGNDSLVNTKFCFDQNLSNFVMYIDTGVGIDENREFVIDFCKKYNYPLIVTYSEKILKNLGGKIDDFEDFVMNYGFPSKKSHNWIYRYLKERSIREISKYIEDKFQLDKYEVEFYTGVRRVESVNRMGQVEWKNKGERWIWKAPIASWSDKMMELYRDKYNLPENPVVKKIHRSGDCFCGAFGYRDQELIDLQLHYPYLFNKLMEIENKAIELRGKEESSYWGWLNAENLDELKSKNPPMLCGSCIIETDLSNVDLEDYYSKEYISKQSLIEDISKILNVEIPNSPTRSWLQDCAKSIVDKNIHEKI